MAILLMTGTINSGYFGNVQTTVSDTELRRQQYYYAIERYIRESKFSTIVFAENSQYPFDVKRFEDLSSQYDKQFEFLEIETSIEETRKRGKSYGEAHLISQAFLKSKYLSQNPFFYKVTGRVYVENINSLINAKCQNEFITHRTYCACYTVFFKVTRQTFQEVLLDAESECDERDGWKFIEKIYFDRLKNQRILYFKKYPRLHGIVGGNGDQYDRSWKVYLIKDILLKIGYYKYGKPMVNWKTLEKLEHLIPVNRKI